MLVKIRKGGRTLQHGASLRDAGFKVEENSEFFLIEVNGITEEIVDASTPEALKAACRVCVETKVLFTYKTPFRVADGSIRTSIVAANTVLGSSLSCLMAKVAGAAKGATPVLAMSDL